MRYLLLVLSFFVEFTVYAQEKAIAKVHYIFEHVNDTAQREQPLVFETITYLGNIGSFFTEGSTLNAQEVMRKQFLSANFDGNIVIEKRADPLRNYYIIIPSKAEIFEVHNIAGENFVTKTDYDVPSWTIEDDTSTIGGYLCQKAVTKFKGRNYTAWFTAELPFSFGPWKLHGLPGLILAAKDDKEEVTFKYGGFEKVDSEDAKLIAAPENTISAKPEEIIRLKTAYEENPSAYFKSRESVRRSGTSSGANTSKDLDARKIKSISIKNAENYRPSKNTNNPIELP
ncbi:GLPGLI family protein [Sphingobacterium alkalisoli]|uniref:GLPGLI family protein n=1 Tax=Sphingobacterium alkalisoli TaxID=1874115 RepID=A0A4U0H9B8_9SPHI|nr:GLPGLI family protein [Sphingobacterium alkalisoli]TJY68376.1 GLPGLI family protein [Sphingobacterium alkalisoli]GGH06915.1 hypothetical protein GCM10011418_03850 [Sphingobacterium alkalisoli]